MRFKHLLAAAGLVAAASAHAVDEPVRIEPGLVGGSTVSRGVQIFRGIPFAAPPVGDNRWREPQPVEPWDRVRNASEFGDVCIQPPGQGRLNIAVLPDGPPMSEDCLYLNVWTPAESADAQLPVMLYFYGGAFREGAGSVPLYDGTELARKGAVVVTMNYRLGPFGFFAHPSLTADSEHGTSGNYGLMDMIASARWVKDNIAAFGGDADNVTVFGQSAGAMAIGVLIASPAGEGLFERAITQSLIGFGPPGSSMQTLAQAEEGGRQLAAELDAETADALRALDAATVEENLRGGNPLVDGYVVTEDPFLTLEAGEQNRVDVLLGSNKDEALFARPTTVEQFRERTRGQWGELADEYLALYPHSTDAAATESSKQQSSDNAFWLSRLWARYQAELGRSAYLFYFAQEPPAPEGEEPAASHAAEVPYVFDNIGELPLFPDGSDPERAARSVPDLELADLVSSYWVNFARTGNPNGRGLPRWPEYGPGGETVRAKILDAAPGAEQLPSVERLAVYDKRYERQLEDAR